MLIPNQSTGPCLDRLGKPPVQIQIPHQGAQGKLCLKALMQIELDIILSDSYLDSLTNIVAKYACMGGFKTVEQSHEQIHRHSMDEFFKLGQPVKL